MTLEERLVATGYRPAGFDYMRITLAVLILCWHSVVTSYGRDAQHAVGEAARPVVAVLLPMFFTLSGFLVAGSLERCRTIGMFLGLRVIRIFPALAVESLISALVLGAALTTLTPGEYFSHPLFHKYFLNILGEPQFYLPGVFDTNPSQKVNGQLWTVPWELRCYVVLAALAAFGLVRRRWIILAAILGMTAMSIAVALVKHPGALSATAGSLQGPELVVGFLAGVALYMYRERVRWSMALGLIALAAGLILLAIPYGAYPALLPISYATVCLGLANPPKVGILKTADYSYGIFLYSYALQQTVMYLAPGARHWWINIAIALPLSLAVSAASWHFIEKPALGWRRYLVSMEKGWLATRLAQRLNRADNADAAAAGVKKAA